MYCRLFELAMSDSKGNGMKLALIAVLLFSPFLAIRQRLRVSATFVRSEPALLIILSTSMFTGILNGTPMYRRPDDLTC